jgi:hypothetical protein
MSNAAISKQTQKVLKRSSRHCYESARDAKHQSDPPSNLQGAKHSVPVREIACRFGLQALRSVALEKACTAERLRHFKIDPHVSLCIRSGKASALNGPGLTAVWVWELFRTIGPGPSDSSGGWRKFRGFSPSPGDSPAEAGAPRSSGHVVGGPGLARVSLHIGDGSGGWVLHTCHGLAIASARFALHGNPHQGLVNSPKTRTPSPLLRATLETLPGGGGGSYCGETTWRGGGDVYCSGYPMQSEPFWDRRRAELWTDTRRPVGYPNLLGPPGKRGTYAQRSGV